jgi:hypothetical protein
MSSYCFTCVTGQGTKLYRVLWHSDPLSINEHLHPGWRYPVRCGATILVIAATVTPSIFQGRVEVVGVGGWFETDEEDSRTEIKLKRHRPLSLPQHIIPHSINSVLYSRLEEKIGTVKLTGG